MKYYFFKKSERRAVILTMVKCPVRTIGEDGVASPIPELTQYAEVDARIANRLAVALNETDRLGSKAPPRMRWIVRDFLEHANFSNGPWLPAKWHQYAVSDVPNLNSTTR